ncbi:MFS transporter (plasmid) [Pseudoalteromonas sp. T1lg65]|uniref:MFS transporter n=1 Tax=Pseudoalteromonas sp. T1lg65 TaxID=2077101 RepID=UPI003F7AD07A
MSLVVILAMLLMSCSQLASQIYIPVLPEITESLALSPGLSQAAVVSYFTTLGASQLLVGPLRDKFGDRPLFMWGQGVLLVGTVCCSIAQNAELFFIGRVLQGVGAASPVLIGRTILAANLSGARLKSAMATLAMSLSITAIITPVTAGALSIYLGWQGMSALAAVYFFAVTILGWMVIPKRHKTTSIIRPANLISHYYQLVIDKSFISLASLKWLPTFLYLTIQLYLPFHLADKFGFSASQIGQAMMYSMCGLLVGATLAKVLQKRHCYLKIVLWLWPFLLLSTGLLLVAGDSAVAILIAYAAIMLVFGAYFPSYMHLIGVLYPEQPGTTNALVGAIELLCFSCLAWWVNQWLLSDSVSLAWLVLGCAVLLLVTWRHLSIAMPNMQLERG